MPVGTSGAKSIASLVVLAVTCSVVTPRGEHGDDLPGMVFLVDNDQLRTRLILSDRNAGGGGRVEHVGFDRDEEHVFVSRNLDVGVFNLESDQVAAFSSEETAPVHHVNGYLKGGFVLAADGKGRVWLENPESRRKIRLRNSGVRGLVIDSAISESGDEAMLVMDDGRALSSEEKVPRRKGSRNR